MIPKQTLLILLSPFGWPGPEGDRMDKTTGREGRQDDKVDRLFPLSLSLCCSSGTILEESLLYNIYEGSFWIFYNYSITGNFTASWSRNGRTLKILKKIHLYWVYSSSKGVKIVSNGLFPDSAHLFHFFTSILHIFSFVFWIISFLQLYWREIYRKTHSKCSH